MEGAEKDRKLPRNPSIRADEETIFADTPIIMLSKSRNEFVADLVGYLIYFSTKTI